MNGVSNFCASVQQRITNTATAFSSWVTQGNPGGKNTSLTDTTAKRIALVAAPILLPASWGLYKWFKHSADPAKQPTPLTSPKSGDSAEQLTPPPSPKNDDSKEHFSPPTSPKNNDSKEQFTPPATPKDADPAKQPTPPTSPKNSESSNKESSVDDGKSSFSPTLPALHIPEGGLPSTPNEIERTRNPNSTKKETTPLTKLSRTQKRRLQRQNRLPKQ